MYMVMHLVRHVAAIEAQQEMVHLVQSIEAQDDPPGELIAMHNRLRWNECLLIYVLRSLLQLINLVQVVHRVELSLQH